MPIRAARALLPPLIALVLVPSAGASEVRYTPEGAPFDSSGETTPPRLEYVADAGETNRLTISFEAGSYTFRDPGAAIRPGACSAVGPHEVRCTFPGFESFGSLSADTADRDDRVTIESAPNGPAILGGDGDDELDASTLAGARLALFGGHGDDTLLGGAGGDSLQAGGGRDVLRGGEGADRLSDDDGTGGSAIDADTLDGGAGHDGVGYTRFAPVTIDLSDPRPDGQEGENDVLVGIEDATIMGPASDVLIGNDAVNRLAAGGGDNRIEARGGNDSINVGSRHDAVFGGDGDDVIDANGKFLHDRSAPIACGAGSDLVQRPGPTDVLERDCERVEYIYFPRASSRPVALDKRRGIAAFRWLVECPRGERCSALLALRSGRASLGSAYVRVYDGFRRFHVRLTPAGRKLARSGRAAPVQVSVRRDRRRYPGARLGRGETRTYGIRGLAP